CNCTVHSRNSLDAGRHHRKRSCPLDRTTAFQRSCTLFTRKPLAWVITSPTSRPVRCCAGELAMNPCTSAPPPGLSMTTAPRNQRPRGTKPLPPPTPDWLLVQPQRPITRMAKSRLAMIVRFVSMLIPLHSGVPVLLMQEGSTFHDQSGRGAATFFAPRPG